MALRVLGSWTKLSRVEALAGTQAISLAKLKFKSEEVPVPWAAAGEALRESRRLGPGFCLTIYADLSSQTVGLACPLWPVLAFPQG